MAFTRAQWSTTFKPTGYRVGYRLGVANYCPGCGQSQWIVGRSSAQCAFCDTPMPFVGQLTQPHAQAA